MLRASEVAECRTQGVADHLAALSECSLHHPHKKGLVAVEVFDGVAAQADDGALDLGRGIEDRFIDREEVFDVVPRLQQYREDAVLLRSGGLGQAYGHLLLDHADALGHPVAVFEDAEKDLRRDVVGEVADHTERALETPAQIHLQEVALDQPGREVGVVRAEVVHAFGVDLGAVGREVAAFQQKPGQHPHAAAHFEHVAGGFGRSARERAADLARYVQVRQEVLSQRFFCSYFAHKQCFVSGLRARNLRRGPRRGAAVRSAVVGARRGVSQSRLRWPNLCRGVCGALRLWGRVGGLAVAAPAAETPAAVFYRSERRGMPYRVVLRRCGLPGTTAAARRRAGGAIRTHPRLTFCMKEP